MLARTHIMSAVSLTVPLLTTMPIEVHFSFVTAVVLGSLFPDLDEKGSFLSRRVYVVSLLISQFTEHRGITHTLLALPIYFFIAFVVMHLGGASLFFSTIIALGFMIGCLIHLLMDSATRSGVAIFLPFSKKRYYILSKSYRVFTGGKLEKFAILPLFSFIAAIEMFIYLSGLQYTGNLQ